MIQDPIPTLKATLEEVRDQFESWRTSREKRTAIPETLWDAAVILSKEYCTLQISKALRLNFTSLKNRVQASNSGFSPKSDSDPAFVELDFGRSIFPAECLVEMEDKSGSKMKVHLKGVTGVDLLELGRAFWSKGA